ncbi:MAG TPA: DUF998 domain-containing protein [Candidatus Lokiarchaeia archaeon]|nr:DUF998 domain-containing protein [Candidatus Lokiarchaeia archaeon]
MQSLKTVWRGEFSRDFLTQKYWPVMFVLFWVPVFIASFFYPGYNIVQDYISDLGVPANNPIGWPIWSFGHAIFGILLFPVIRYLYRQLAGEPRKYLRVGTVFLILSAIGILGLGTIPQFSYPGLGEIHATNATLLIGGTYLNLFSWFPLMRKDPKMKQSIVVARLVAGLVILGGLALSVLPAFFLDDQAVGCSGGVCPWYLSTPFWEWTFLIGMMVNDVLLFFVIPERKSC